MALLRSDFKPFVQSNGNKTQNREISKDAPPCNRGIRKPIYPSHQTFQSQALSIITKTPGETKSNRGGGGLGGMGTHTQ